MMWGGCCGSWGAWGALGGWSWIGLLINLAVWVIIGGGLIAVTLWAVRRFLFNNHGWTSGVRTSVAPADDPKAILKARYARGEITREQYLAMLQDIEEREVRS